MLANIEARDIKISVRVFIDKDYGFFGSFHSAPGMGQYKINSREILDNFLT